MWVSKNQSAKAREYDVFSYLKVTDPRELVRVSRNEYCLRSHDSFRISNGKWHWWSRGKAGHTAVDYLVEVKGYSFPNAVIEVLRAMNEREPMKQKEQVRQFILPKKSESSNIMRGYLESRGIDEGLIKLLESMNLIYEDAIRHSVIFVGKDYEDAPKHAAYRATDGSSLKGDVRGSDKRFCFKMPYRKSKVLRVFEGPIDLLSFVSLCIKDGVNWTSEDMISVCGVHGKSASTEYKLPAALEEYIKQNLDVKQIFLHFDNDEVGAGAARNIMRALGESYEVINLPPPYGKDYNEYLRILVKEESNGR